MKEASTSSVPLQTELLAKAKHLLKDFLLERYELNTKCDQDSEKMVTTGRVRATLMRRCLPSETHSLVIASEKTGGPSTTIDLTTSLEFPEYAFDFELHWEKRWDSIAPFINDGKPLKGKISRLMKRAEKQNGEKQASTLKEIRQTWLKHTLLDY